jgi:hypothetical protein
MLLVHSAREREAALSILREGIKTGAQLNRSNHAGADSNFRADAISLTATKVKRLEIIESDERRETFAYFKSSWGTYHFVIKPSYVIRNVAQLRNNNKDFYDKEFFAFVKRKGIKRFDDEKQVFGGAPNEIISLVPIPAQEIDSLVLPYEMSAEEFIAAASAKTKIFYHTSKNRYYGLGQVK